LTEAYSAEGLLPPDRSFSITILILSAGFLEMLADGWQYPGAVLAL